VSDEAEQRRDDGAGRADDPGALSRLLQEIALAPADDVVAAWKEQLRPGAQVGRFEIRGEIGRGGFGSVYEAVDPELGRNVALKALRPHRTGRELSAEWIKKEAEAVAKLNHPNIVTLFDVGRCAAGPYLVMELLRGETLAARLEKGALPLDEALRVADEMAGGLAHAHGQGVLHRDLKPANAFLCEDGRVKILDFGLAHLLGSEVGSSGGTPGFMAPEQARGETVDERADVYALGVVLFQLLTGKLPYEKKAERGVPSGGTPPEIPGAPSALVKILGRLLARDPAERMANGAEAHAALSALRKSREPRRALRIAQALALVAVLAAVAAVLWPRPPPLPPGRLTVALADTANLTGNPALDEISGLLATALEQSPRVSLLPHSLVAARAARPGAEPPARVDAAGALRAARETKAHVALSLEARAVAGGLEIEARGVDAARDRPLFTIREQTGGPAGIPDALDRMSDRIRSALQEDPAKAPPPMRLAQVVSPRPEAWEAWLEGQRLAREGRNREAKEAYERAVAADADFPLPHVALAVADEYGDRDALRAHVEAALRHPDRIPAKERRLVEATSAEISWDWTRALERYDQVIAGWPDAPEAYVQAAVLTGTRFGDAALARPYLEKVVELATGTPDDRIKALERLGRLDEALAEAHRLALAKPGRRSLTVLSWIHRVRGERIEALDAARRALEAEPGALDEDLLWSMVEGDALDELPAGLAKLALNGHRRAALAAYDARRPMESAPAFIRGVFHNLRVDFIFDRADADAIWTEASAVLLFGNASAVCLTTALVLAGDLERAERIDALWPMLDGRNPCSRTFRAVRAWRQGDPAAAVQVMDGLDFASSGFYRGAMLLDLGRNRQAVEEFRRYRRFPNRYDGTTEAFYRYPQSLYLEALALEREGDVAGATAAVERMLRMWKDADPDHPLLADARGLRARVAKASKD
jgi:tetratricopeptide (TPR) repeat protein